MNVLVRGFYCIFYIILHYKLWNPILKILVYVLFYTVNILACINAFFVCFLNPLLDKILFMILVISLSFIVSSLLFPIFMFLLRRLLLLLLLTFWVRSRKSSLVLRKKKSLNQTNFFFRSIISVLAFFYDSSV